MDGSRASMSPSGVATGDGGGTSPASGEFPAGLRVLVVDDDLICLKILEKMLRNCLYEVTTSSRAVIALSMLREKKGEFDLVLSDVYMPDMDGFKLLEHIGLEMDLPVIMMSSDDGKDVVMKGVTHGACDYLIKPVRMEALKNIWQHVVRKKRNEQSGVEDGEKHKRSLDDSDNGSSANEGNWKNGKRQKEGKEEEDEIEENEDSSSQKKPRVVWSIELHQEFVKAVKQLGVDKAVPKKILELMNVPGITRENVASHLQKYRLYLRRLSREQQHGRFDTPFTGATDAEFVSSDSLDGFELQALGVSGQHPAPNLMNMNAGPRRVTNTSSGMFAVNPIGFYNSDPQIANSSRLNYSSGLLLNNKNLDTLWGASTNMEASQPGSSEQALQSYGNMGVHVSEGASSFPNLPSSLRTNSSFPRGGSVYRQGCNSYAMQMTQQGLHFPLPQQQMVGQSLNGQQILPHQMSGHVSGRGGAQSAMLNGNTSTAGTFVNTTSYGAVPLAQFDEFQNHYSTLSSIVASGRGSTGVFQEAVPTTGNIEALGNTTSFKGVDDFIPNYGLSKGHDWRSDNINLSCMSGQQLGAKQNNNDLGSSISIHQDFNARKEVISLRSENERKVGFNIYQHNNTVWAENSARVKAESVPNAGLRDLLFPVNSIPNELMGVIARQPQEGVGQGEPELNFDVYAPDDIRV